MCCMLQESMKCIFDEFAAQERKPTGAALCVLGCQVLHSAFAAHMRQVLHIYPNTQSVASILVY